MKTLAILAIVVGILLLASVVVVTAVVSHPAEKQVSSPQVECSSCGNSCTAESNCGQATCGAVNGGTCGCNKG